MRWHVVLAFFLLAIIGVLLWPTSSTLQPTEDSLRRGLNFIYKVSLDSATWEENGEDMLGCFASIADVVTEPRLKAMAKSMGMERAKVWRAAHAHLPSDLNASSLCRYVFGAMSADMLVPPDPDLKEEIRVAARRFTPVNFLRFDPTKEPPPSDIPYRCKKCGNSNARGATACQRCGNKLELRHPYDVLCDALIVTYSGDRYGVRLGSSFADVVKWIPHMHPYPKATGPGDEFDSTAYLITHIIYTLNDYDLYKLKREWLQPEYDFLRASFHIPLKDGDAETLGEFMDSLRSLGVENTDPQLREGIRFLLSHQNADGSWGSSKDSYTRYHTTWTAMAGLIDYNWRGERLSFPEVLPHLLQQPR